MSKITYIGIKQAGKAFHIINQKMLRDDLSKLSNGKYRLIIEKYRKDKSLPQLGYYYACVLPMFLKAAIDAGWELTSVEEADAWLKSMFANRELINKHTGQVIEVPALKRNMTTTEFSTFINQVRDHAAEFLGCYIPEPESQLAMQYEQS
jgi:hypothetical protein